MKKHKQLREGQKLPQRLYDRAWELSGPDPDLAEWTRAVREAMEELGYSEGKNGS